LLNKQISHNLGITEKTVKVHRAHAMAKLDLRNAADLAKFQKLAVAYSAPPGALPFQSAERFTDLPAFGRVDLKMAEQIALSHHSNVAGKYRSPFGRTSSRIS